MIVENEVENLNDIYNQVKKIVVHGNPVIIERVNTDDTETKIEKEMLEINKKYKSKNKNYNYNFN